MASSDRNRGAVWYLSWKRVETAGSARTMTSAATGTTNRAAYLTDDWNTF